MQGLTVAGDLASGVVGEDAIGSSRIILEPQQCAAFVICICDSTAHWFVLLGFMDVT